MSVYIKDTELEAQARRLNTGVHVTSHYVGLSVGRGHAISRQHTVTIALAKPWSVRWQYEGIIVRYYHGYQGRVY